MTSNLTSFDDALRMVLGAAPKPRREAVDLDDAVGRVLAQDVRADRDLPPFDRAALDGYAYRGGASFADGHVWPIVGEVAAGSRPPKNLREGTCVRISTGAPVPRDAHGIVPVEEAQQVEGGVLLKTACALDARQRKAVAARGEDAKRGDRLLGKGLRIGYAAMPVLAAVGLDMVAVCRRPTIAVVVTGDELVPAGTRPSPVQIRSSNDVLIRSVVASAGVSSLRHLGIAEDDPVLLKRRLARGLDADVLVISGGISVGPHDYVTGILRELGVKIVFHKVAIRPGKPVLFGVRATKNRRTAVFGLPGNPVSLLLCALEFLLPFLKAFQGEDPAVNPGLPVMLEEAIRRRGDLLHFVPCTLAVESQGCLRAREVSLNGSGDFVSASRADAFLRVPGDGVERARGSVLTADPLPGVVPRREVS